MTVTTDLPPQAPGQLPRILNNTIWSLAGQTVPILVAVVCLPMLIHGLGTPRFGVLALVWLMQAICTQFAAGLGRSTTKTVAEYLGAGREQELTGLIWSAIAGHAALGLAGGTALAAATPLLTGRLLAIPAGLESEAELAFYLLAAGVPVFLLLDALRSVLQALSRFDLLAAVQIPCQAFNYLAPLVVLWFSSSLVPVTAAMLVSRLLMLVACFGLVITQLPSLKRPVWPQWPVIWKLLPQGGWMTVVNLSGATLATMDRFVIGSVISLSAVAWYSTAFDITTKLWILPASLLPVLFPVFSSLQMNRRDELAPLFWRAVTLLNAAIVPVVCLLLLCGEHLLRLWVGDLFAEQGAPVVRWVACGSAICIASQVPLTLLQTTGRSRLTAMVQFVLLPLYALAIWRVAPHWGIQGIAAIWFFRG
ncbi:MAG: oligosaccharide flippase family protein, partial [Planctomycetaceae bacterium]|nr:oligosaccharide flippase family protein [Planctomycetaceae bacterium]